jgi:uroporphyrinogen-III decarboxylase
VDIEHPLQVPFVRDNLALWQQMERHCRDLRWEGRPVRLHPRALTGTDGPVTVACNLCGTEFLTLLAAEPELADRIMAHIVRAAILRRQAFAKYWGDRIGLGAGMADDSVALIGTAMYRERVLPHHRTYYEACPPGPRGMHLCGDATRHFPLLHQELGITSFDTGFPVDHGALRRQLGPEVEILGGPPVSLLLQGTPEQVFTACRDILRSGVMTGGRFILREGNNLPPRCPSANLAAMYQASLEFGRYPAA